MLSRVGVQPDGSWVLSRSAHIGSSGQLMEVGFLILTVYCKTKLFLSFFTAYT